MMADRNREGSKRESRLDDRVDRVFLELLGADRMVGRSGTAFRPNADVYYSRSQEAILVKLELPGVDPEAVRLEAKGKTLIVTGQRKDPEPTRLRRISYAVFCLKKKKKKKNKQIYPPPKNVR